MFGEIAKIHNEENERLVTISWPEMKLTFKEDEIPVNDCSYTLSKQIVHWDHVIICIDCTRFVHDHHITISQRWNLQPCRNHWKSMGEGGKSLPQFSILVAYFCNHFETNHKVTWFLPTAIQIGFLLGPWKHCWLLSERLYLGIIQDFQSSQMWFYCQPSGTSILCTLNELARYKHYTSLTSGSW